MFDRSILTNYWKTLKNNNHDNINCIYIKKPYIEKYIFDSILIENEDEFYKFFLSKLEEEDIKLEDISLFVYNIFEFKNNDKKNVNKFIFDIKLDNEEDTGILFSILKCVISYTKFYYTSAQLLFFDECENENILTLESSLYKCIYCLIEMNEQQLRDLYSDDLKLEIFISIMNDFIQSFQSVLEKLEEKKIIVLDNYDYKNMLIKILFKNWYEIYKRIGKPIIKINKMEEPVKNKKNKLSFLKKILCLPNY